MMSFSSIWELCTVCELNIKIPDVISSKPSLIVDLLLLLCWDNAAGDDIGLNFIIFCSIKSVIERGHEAGTVLQDIFNCILTTAVHLLVSSHPTSPQGHSANSNCWVISYSVLQYLNFIQIFHKIITIYNYIQHWCWIVSIVLHQVS